jgi:hypothetical protein
MNVEIVTADRKELCVDCGFEHGFDCPPKKVLFLDIDGVVNHKETFRKGEHFPLDQYCAFLVGKIQLETDCVVVLSSSWRILEEAVEEVKKRVVPIHDVTGRCCSGIRGVEIYNWINKNIPYKMRDTTFKYAILDDESDMLLWQKDHFFQTGFLTGGLTEEIANKVIAHLNR